MAISDNQIYVDYHQVNNVLQSLEDADSRIQGVLNWLDDAITPLRATWSGFSENEYIKVQARWTDDTNQMKNMLTQCHQTLGDMSNNYSNTDHNLAAQWGSIG